MEILQYCHTVYLSEYYKIFSSLNLYNYTPARKFYPNSNLHQHSSPWSHFTQDQVINASPFSIHIKFPSAEEIITKISPTPNDFFVCLWYCNELLIPWVSVPYSCPNNLGTHYMKTGPCLRFPDLLLDLITDPIHCRGWCFPSSTELDIAE